MYFRVLPGGENTDTLLLMETTVSATRGGGILMGARKLSRLWLLLGFLVFFSAIRGYASDVSAASCSHADVQTAFNAATHDGDIVSVPAGSCTWTSAVTPPCASWTLEGAGAGSTNITVNNSGGNGLSLSCSGKSPRITGFTWTRQSTSPSGMFYISGTGMSFRIDHNTINQVSSWGRWLWVEGTCASPGCLVDHNSITNVGGIVSAEISSDTTGCINTSPVNADNCAGTTQWLQPMVLDQGTKEVYFEDNTFSWTSFIDNDMLDCQNGGRYVFRHNTVNGNDIFGHGYDSVSNSCLEMTVYRNTMTVNNPDAPGAVLYRGGTGVVYDNIMPTSSHYAGYISIQNYRSNSGGANTCALGRVDCHLCNGTNAYDGNQIGGWPCRQGPGRGSSASAGLASYPLYEWDNCSTTVPCTGTSGQRTIVTDISDSYNDFAANRDWYDSVSPFTGTVGIGVGLLSGRPSTCKAGVAYWATDTATLYQCAAGNVWTAYYKPYAYPHPLQGGAGGGGGGVTPPTGLTAAAK
jgi:hypothetical protein